MLLVCFEDAEAAAELGRTLLERNRELESTIRQQQALIDDQTQEMQVGKWIAKSNLQIQGLLLLNLFLYRPL